MQTVRLRKHELTDELFNVMRPLVNETKQQQNPQLNATSLILEIGQHAARILESHDYSIPKQPNDCYDETSFLFPDEAKHTNVSKTTV